MKVEVADVYSPPRVTKMAEQMGLRSGWALDLTTCDDDGRAWNFDQLEMRNRAVRQLLRDEPILFIGSPMCTAFSQMNNINYSRMDPREVARRKEYGRKHFEFCTKLYDMQWSAGRYFLHEHPAEASSWKERCIVEFMRKHGVTRVNGDQCQYGLTTTANGVTGPARKNTGFMTNSPCIARQLNRKCPNRNGWQEHKHIHLEGGRTRAAQVYPPELCKAICNGLSEQLQADRDGQFMLANVEASTTTSSGELKKAAEELKKKYRTVEEDLDEQMEEAWDDVSGAQLDPKAVRAARGEEVDYIHKMNLYTKVPTDDCYKRTGKAPISVRWIDINKGDTDRPNYRSRLVAREINTYKRDDLFAGTPPLEALKLLLSMSASGNTGELIMINDVSRAFFHAKATRDVFVQLPDEDRKPGEERLEYSRRLVEHGFSQGIATPCVFHHKEKGIRTLVHGDDYVSVGKPQHLKWMKEMLEHKYQIKTHVLGPGEGEVQQLKILNRIISWDGNRGITYEADPRHVEIMVEQLKLGEAKTVTTPGTKDEGKTQEDSETRLGKEEASQYRALVARCNYLGPDRPDIAYSVKELARGMAEPTRGNLLQLKRLGRYLKGRPRMQQLFRWQEMPKMLTTYTDAAWAGCKATRKSTTGGCMKLGNHSIKGWSKTQSLVALSSGESELYATLKAAAETLGMLSIMKDLGWIMRGELWGDASAALGIIHRRGLGKTRHIDTGLLWIQQTAAEKRLSFNKVLGEVNPADLYTKYLDEATTLRHTEALAYSFTTGRAAEAPKLHLLEALMYDVCETVLAVSDAMNSNKSLSKYSRERMINREVLAILGTTGTVRNVQNRHAKVNNGLTCSGQRVLWGYNWQARGSNGLNSAPPSQPQGSTLTFQHNAGVPCGTGLRHGVTMHPRGRHSREGMIPLSHGTYTELAREQQPPPQPQPHYYQPRKDPGSCPRRREDTNERSSVKKPYLLLGNFESENYNLKRQKPLPRREHECGYPEAKGYNHNYNTTVLLGSCC